MIFFFFLVGLIVGSFLNVVIFRIETEETIMTGRSRCGSCRQTIAWYDNIPLLSYLLLRGKCRRCHARISIQYPLVELATAALFAGAACVFFADGSVSATIETVFVCGLIAGLLVVFTYDLRYMEIPVSVLNFAVVWTVLCLCLIDLFSLPWPDSYLDMRIAEGMIGGGIAFVLFWALVFFSKETWMGWGDVWLALVLGLALGWKLLLPALTVAFGSGAAVGLVLIALGRKGMKSQIPFGPFLAASVIFMLFLDRMAGETFQRFFFF